MTQDHRVIDHAPTTEEAWHLAGQYIVKLREMGIEGWLVGVEPDPFPVDSHHGYRIYAVPRQPQPQS